jgi:hypothetical protein
VWSVGGVLGAVVDSVGGVDGVDSVGVGDSLGEAEVAVGVGEVVVAEGDGDEAVTASIFARRVALIVGSLASGLSPAPVPPSSCSGPELCSPTTAGGRTGATSTAPSLTPNHIAGPSPTATIAPKSAAGPRSMSDLPRVTRSSARFPALHYLFPETPSEQPLRLL